MISDKMKIALALRNSTYEECLSCSLLENEVLTDCKHCTLKLLCEEIDEAVKRYTEQTTNVIDTFSFE